MNEENKNNKRGLASADQETREEVASQGGKASHSGDQSSEENSPHSDQSEDNDEEFM
jgi:general stress protein YciG